MNNYDTKKYNYNVKNIKRAKYLKKSAKKFENFSKKKLCNI